MPNYRIVVLPGDGIGPEVMRETLKVLKGALPGSAGTRIDFSEHPIGAGQYKKTGEILPTELIGVSTGNVFKTNLGIDHLSPPTCASA